MNTYDLPVWSFFVIIPLLLWSLYWKALALWHSARRGNAIWFVVLLLVNTLGILDIVYLIIAGKLKTGELFSKGDVTSDKVAK